MDHLLPPAGAFVVGLAVVIGMAGSGKRGVYLRFYLSLATVTNLVLALLEWGSTGSAANLFATGLVMGLISETTALLKSEKEKPT